MKNLIKFLLLSPVVFSTFGCGGDMNKGPQAVDVVVISGQSNAVGCTKNKCIEESMDYSKYDEYLEGYSGIKIAYDCWTKDWKGEDQHVVYYSQNQSKDDGFVDIRLGQGNAQSNFGPEIGIGEALNEKYNGKLFLIKYACGASNLKDDWLEKDSPMYPRLIAYVKKQMNNLKEAGYIPTIKAFCWMQGEGDSYGGYYDKYYANTKQFVSNIRDDLSEFTGEKVLPFIDAGISNAQQWQYYKQVNEAKKKFADESEFNIYIDTIAEGLHTNLEPTIQNPDTAHYDSESEVKLGHLFAEAFEPFLEPVK